MALVVAVVVVDYMVVVGTVDGIAEGSFSGNIRKVVVGSVGGAGCVLVVVVGHVLLVGVRVYCGWCCVVNGIFEGLVSIWV